MNDNLLNNKDMQENGILAKEINVLKKKIIELETDKNELKKKLEFLNSKDINNSKIAKISDYYELNIQLKEENKDIVKKNEEKNNANNTSIDTNRLYK